jgi:pimeloyl-ACP methyl ester carboxylesterase
VTWLATASLIRWLGPWAQGRSPRHVLREELLLAGRVRAHLYRPDVRKVRAAWLVAPGLHYLGPADPRFERFCRVLAAAGALVLAPFLPDHLALRISPRAADDLALAFDALEERARALGLPPPAVFSISFGSQPAIELAARESHRARVGALALFGGFADFAATVRFVLTGRAGQAGAEVQRAHDPTNAPVVLLHLLDELARGCDRSSLERALRQMVERTWGRPELKLPGAREAVARELAAALGEAERELFLCGCLLREGAAAQLEDAVRRAGAAFAFADPRPALARVRAPVLIVHGRDDDVIPWVEAPKLREALPAGHPAQLLITGLYGHTASAQPGLLALAREALQLLRVVRALARAPAAPRRDKEGPRS